MAMVHINKDMVEKLHTFMKEKGVFGIMPVSPQPGTVGLWRMTESPGIVLPRDSLQHV